MNEIPTDGGSAVARPKIWVIVSSVAWACHSIRIAEHLSAQLADRPALAASQRERKGYRKRVQNGQ